MRLQVACSGYWRIVLGAEFPEDLKVVLFDTAFIASLFFVFCHPWRLVWVRARSCEQAHFSGAVWATSACWRLVFVVILLCVRCRHQVAREHVQQNRSAYVCVSPYIFVYVFRDVFGVYLSVFPCAWAYACVLGGSRHGGSFRTVSRGFQATDGLAHHRTYSSGQARSNHDKFPEEFVFVAFVCLGGSALKLVWRSSVLAWRCGLPLPPPRVSNHQVSAALRQTAPLGWFRPAPLAHLPVLGLSPTISLAPPPL